MKKIRSQTTRITGYLRNVLWRNSYIVTDAKVRICKSCVRSIMTYAVETTVDTVKIVSTQNNGNENTKNHLNLT